MWKLISSLLFLIIAVNSFAFEIVAYDESKIGPKECAKGSSYWCQDLRSAKRCGAVKHCIQVVWENKKLPPDSSDVCETCKKMVQEARDELMSNTTQELLKEVLEGTCRIYFPIKIIAEECEKLVDEFIPEFVDMLASRMDPQMVCSVAWLCNSNKVKDLIKDINIVDEVQSKNDDVCQECKTFTTDLIATVQNIGKDEFQNKLLGVCNMLSGLIKTTCHMEVKSHSDEIYNFITHDLTPEQFCAFTAMCIDGFDPVEKKKNLVKVTLHSNSKKAGDLECDFCVQLATRLREMITENSTKEEVRTLLLNLCSQTRSFKDRCVTYVNEYFDFIYDYITKDMDPKLVCMALGICESQLRNSARSYKKPFIAGTDESASYGRPVNWTLITPASKKKELGKDSVEVKFPSSKPHQHRRPPTICDTIPQGKPECALCEFALHKLQEILVDKKTQDEIKEAIDKVCSLLPSTLERQCIKFIDDYGSAILAILAQEVDPSLVCTELGICLPAVKLIPIQPLSFKSMARLTMPLKAENAQLPIERMFPSTYRAEGKEACLYCQYSMELLHSLLNINGTKDSIIKGLDNICHSLPSSLRDQCDTFVENYADPFITALQTQNLTVFCDILSFCHDQAAKNLMRYSSSAVNNALDHVNSDGCQVCEATVEILSKLLTNPEASKKIAQAIEKLCSFVPSTIKGKCASMIDVYGQYFIQMIGELADPKLFCQSVELCEAPIGQVHLIGGDKCTFGPSYWCKTKFHARVCKAEEHCKKNVWKN